MLDAVVQTVKDSPVTVSPAVDGLFDVSYYQAVCSLSKPFEQEQFEISPLHPAGVLKLVDHDIADVGSYLFEHERGISVLNQLMEQGIGIW